MKVLHVIDKLNIGGGERVFLDITRLLLDAGVVTGGLVFNPGGGLESQIDERLQLHILNRTNKYAVNKMQEANKICTAYNIVHVHMRHCYAYIKLCKRLFRGKYTIVFHDHFGDIDINADVPRSLKGLLKPEYYIGVSKSLTNWAKNELDLEPSSIFLLSNTIIPNEGVKFEEKKVWKKAMMVANIRPTKNIGFAISLAKKMNISLDVYGNRSDEVYYNEMVDLIGDNERIRIVEGVTDFTNLYNQYDFAIHTAKSETGPLVLMEYMAYGMPFIAYNTGEVVKQVYNTIPEHILSDFDEDRWEERIEVLKKETGVSNKLKNIFHKYFSPEQYIDTCKKIYGSIDY